VNIGGKIPFTLSPKEGKEETLKRCTRVSGEIDLQDKGSC
jgi:hypothetical protein